MEKDNERIIKDIHKVSTEIIRIALTSYMGSEFLSIRNFYDDSGGQGKSFKPTRKGLAIPLNLLGELREAVGKAIDEIEIWQADGGKE